MTLSGNQSLIVNGWSIYAHPLFLDQFEELITTVENLRQKNPQTYRSKNATKRLAAIAKLAFEIIPADPTRREYRQGSTLGEDYKHWFRAKFFQQYRLFFRYHQPSKIIVYAWINDNKSKRAYGDKNHRHRKIRPFCLNEIKYSLWLRCSSFFRTLKFTSQPFFSLLCFRRTHVTLVTAEKTSRN